MPWQQLKISTHGKVAEAISETLLAHNAIAITFKDGKDQPILEPFQQTPLWDITIIEVLFDLSADLSPIINTLQQQFHQSLIEISNTLLPDRDWISLTQQEFPARRFGKKLWICPTWETIQDPNAITVSLDPGLAFGTGSHPTTRLCLEWLDETIKNGDAVIDYGCGSGILAIAAARLGANKIWALDHDPQALQATRENAARNQLLSLQLSITDSKCLPSWQADVLVANILAQPLIELANLFAQLVKPGGKIALSGILEEQISHITDAYEKQFQFESLATHEKWCRWVGQRRTSNF